MKKAFLFVLGMMLLTVGFTGCKYSKPLDGPGMELDSADVAALDSMNVSELTYANMAGIYDDEGQESRISLNTDGTASWCMIGSLNYTEYTYRIEGNTICMKAKEVDSEEECYEYDPDTRTLKNEQGAVYYRQVVE
jgi:hypothetical protein